jgi:hypothetical protein
MAVKYEWKKSEKQWYAPTATPQEVVVPSFGFFVIDGKGNPNGPEFPPYVQVLYALAYGVRMSAKAGLELPNFFEYTVYPLEGVWDLSVPPGASGPIDKGNLVFSLMIRQPDFLDEAGAARVLAAVAAKKKLPLLDLVRFERIEEGRCLQMLHTGPYDAEPASFSRMQDFCRKESLARVGQRHREIYLSDPSRTASADLRTVLRCPIRDNFSCD